MNDERQLVHSKEKTYFTICLLFSIPVYMICIITIVPIVGILLLLLISFILRGLMIGNIINNGVKLTIRQFPHIYARVEQLSRRMGISEVPEVYIIESGGTLNAFASRFFGKNFVLLYSDVVELEYENGTEELDFIIAHELAHLKRKHITKNLLIFPALWTLLGSAYSRACEYTCDRMAAAYTANPESAIRGLAMLGAGKGLYRKVDIYDFLQTYRRDSSGFATIARLYSSHPPLPLRIEEIQKLGIYPKVSPTQQPYYQQPHPQQLQQNTGNFQSPWG